MINRILIRIKVIQLLYSVLLTENRFTLESSPSAPTKEKRFAYKLYLDTILLFCKISKELLLYQKNTVKKEIPRFIVRVSNEPEIKALSHQIENEDWCFKNLVDYFTSKIKESDIYKNYIRNTAKGHATDSLWENLFKEIIFSDPRYNLVISQLPNYSPRGVERMMEMMANTFINFYATRDNLEDSSKTLAFSMGKARELYMRLLLLPVDITDLRAQQLDDNRHKYLADASDLNPNTKFIDNLLVAELRNNEEIKTYCESKKISWLMEDRNLVQGILKEIIDSEIYSQYMSSPVQEMYLDAELWRNIFKEILFKSELFLDELETKSVFWNDDLEIMGGFALKTFKKFEDKNKDAVLPMYKDEEDERFGKELFEDVLREKDYYRGLINTVLEKDKWDTERLAFMDVIIIMAALSEIINFSKIPLEVSINEYIEIAKSYSSNKSGNFINGILSSLIEKLRADNKIFK